MKEKKEKDTETAGKSGQPENNERKREPDREEDKERTKESSEEASVKEETGSTEKKPKKAVPVLPAILLAVLLGAGGWFALCYMSPESKGDRLAARGAYQEAIAEYRKAYASRPGDEELSGKMRTVYQSWSAQIEGSSDWLSSYRLLQDALADLPADAWITEHSEWLAGCYVREVLHGAAGLGNTKQALEQLQAGYEQIPDPRLEEAIRTLQQSCWKETSRAVYVGEAAVESYLIRKYDEKGNEIWQELYNSDGSTAYTSDFYYENGQIKGMLRREGADAVRYGEWIREGSGAIYTEYLLGGEPLYALSRNDDGTIAFYISYGRNERVKDYIGYEYDEYGDLLVKSVYGDDDIPDIRYVYEYDLSGRVHRETVYDGADRILEYSENSYDSEGRTESIIRYGASGELISAQAYSYDAAGELLSVEVTDAEGAVLGRNLYEYDAEGRVGKETVYAAYDVLCRTYEYEYDTNGNLLKETEYYGDGILRHWTEYTYEYHELP